MSRRKSTAERRSSPDGNDSDRGPGPSGKGSTPYIDYLKVDLLLGLQIPRTGEPAELTFCVITQVQELLFKNLVADLRLARDLLYRRDLNDAVSVLHRVTQVQRVLDATWDAMDAISPLEFWRFRESLGVASGLQSFMFRQLEFILGNKSQQLAAVHRAVPAVANAVDAALRDPSLWDAAIWTLHDRGHAIAATSLRRDWSLTYEAEKSVCVAWMDVYRSPGDQSMVQLGEVLSLVALSHHRWRVAHLLTVERVIGTSPGTGGTSGLEWLRRADEARVFPELLTARSAISRGA